MWKNANGIRIFFATKDRGSSCSPVRYAFGSDWAAGGVKLGPAGDWDGVPNGREVQFGPLR